MSERVNPPPFVGFPQRNPFNRGTAEYQFTQSLISALNQQRIVIEQLWRRTGAGSDDVSDGQTRELFPWAQGQSESSGSNSTVNALFSLNKADTPFFSVSTNHTTAGNEVIEATAALTVTLNQYPDELETVTVARNGTGNVIIDGNGNNIAGASTYTMLADGEVRDLTYLNGEWF